MSVPPLHWLTISELAARIRTADGSSLEATRAALERIAQVDPQIGAFAHVRAEAAQAEAAAADAERRQGRDRGPLHGIPIAVKDLCGVTGLPTSAGTRVLRDRIASEDATVVARLRAAGAVLLGTLHMTEGAYVAHHPDVEPPRNPWNPDRWSGVSSSGSGAATAAGLCVASLGTDTGGSIRFPSAVNGLVGIKPTYGRVSRHGVFPLSESLDHIGPMTRSVRDAAIVLSAIAGFDPDDATSSRIPVPDYCSDLRRGIEGIRIGIDHRYALEGTDAKIVSPILECASVFAAAGASICDVRLPEWEEALQAWVPICAADVALAHAGLFPERRDEYGPELAQILDLGRALPAVELARAQRVRARFSGELERVFEEVDLILCPSIGYPVPERRPDFTDGERVSGMIRFTAPFDMSGSPTISLPCGFAADGLPLSVQLVARHWDESLLCRAGAAFEGATDWHTQHPPV